MSTLHTFWTPQRARLTPIGTTGDGPDWLFLPGGPGLGAESLRELTAACEVQGTRWHLDLPQDGNNRTGSPPSLDTWQTALIEAVQAFKSPILVAHSFGGMLTLTTPKLKTALSGLVLMNTAPDASWMRLVPQQAQRYQLPSLEPLKAQYKQAPSDETFKHFMLTGVLPYFFLPTAMASGFTALSKLPFNHQAYDWAGTQFHQHYQATWVPECPTLIIESEHDYLTPQGLFSKAPAFDRVEIQTVTIQQAGHFPWFEAEQAVVAHLKHFEQRIISYYK